MAGGGGQVLLNLTKMLPNDHKNLCILELGDFFQGFNRNVIVTTQGYP